ncbi:MAG TPA: methyl-accepting chemotaxis protein [Anaeromyxobacter sp.]|nr:methyl-accepting chemotaxis protein [Anaeromyxobacter sp.]
MTQPTIPRSEYVQLRNRLFRRVWAITAPAAVVVAIILAIALDLSKAEILEAVLVAAPLVYVALAVVFAFWMVSQLTHRALYPPDAEAGTRLRRMLELPRKIEIYLYTCTWAVAGTAFTLYCCLRFGRSPSSLLIGLVAGVFSGMFLGPILSHQVEADVRALAVREYQRDTTVAMPSSGGFFWIRQRWYLPYAFSLALVSLFVFCGIVLAAQLRTLARQIAESFQGGALATTPEAIAGKLNALAWSAGIPVAVLAAILLVAFCVLGTMLARRQSMAAASVEHALQTIAAGAPELPRWIATDETGDLARATARVSSEVQQMFVQLRAMASGDLSQELRGTSGLIEAFRESQAAMLQLARLMVALSRGDVSGTASIPGDLGAHFEQLLSAFRATVDQAQTIARGDLRKDVEVPGALGEAIHQMTANLRTMAGQTQTVSADIGTIVVSLQAAVNQLSSATTEQVSAVTETANTTTEMAQTSAVAADRAAELIRQGEAATAVVEDGRDAAESAVQAMGAISSSLDKVSAASAALADRIRKIDDITETVSFLADQSSTLAINAAIEAARAGEAGRGFTVVAREIRTLAADSRKAAAQIRELLAEIRARTAQVDDSVGTGARTVADGNALVARLGEVVGQLGVTVHDAVGLMRQVEGSARQHQTGVVQVSQALTNMQKASESIRDGTRLLGEMSRRAHELSTTLQKTSGAYVLPASA